MSTIQSTLEQTPQLLRNAIDSRITKVRPMATPIDQISRLAGARHADSMEVAYYVVDSIPTSTTIEADIDITSVEFSNITGRVLTITVKDASPFRVSDTVMFPEHYFSEGNNGAKALTGYITKIDENQLTVAVVDEYKNVLRKGNTVVRMGRAATELDVQSPTYDASPKRDSNYCQIFKMQIEESTLMRLSAKEVAWSFNEQEEAAVIDMRLGMEKNFIFGSKKRIYDTIKKEYVYLTGGIWNQAGNQIEISLNTFEIDDFISLARKIFTGNNGSRKRLLIGGSEFVETISKMKTSEKVIFGQTHTKWGLETREIITNFGSLYILHSEVFDQCGYPRNAFVLDQAFVTKFSHIPFKPEKLDLRSSGTRNADAVVLTEASCLILRNPNVHCRIVSI